jgi:hypothetical protein
VAAHAHPRGRDVKARPPAPPTPLVANNFEVLGHHGLGAKDTFGDVWVHGNYAYVGTWSSPCLGRGVRIVDVSNLEKPKMVGKLAMRRGTSAEDVVVRNVTTASFTGDLLAVGIQRCGPNRRLDEQKFGIELWDVGDPTRPRKLADLGLDTGGGGVHELDLFQRGGNVYALLATPFSEFFDPPGGDVVIADVTDPSSPVVVAAWGAGAAGLTPGGFHGIGSFSASFAHSVRASVDGTKALVSYWDLGVITLDISDVTKPTLVGRTTFPEGVLADGDLHSLSEYHAGPRRLLLTNDEDIDPRSPARILYGSSVGIGTESPGGSPLWLEAGRQLLGPVVQADKHGCEPGDYPKSADGSIVVVRTPFPLFDPEPGEEPLCTQEQQDATAAEAGATAVVHELISTATSPQWWDFGDVDIPVVFTDSGTAQGMVTSGVAVLQATPPSYGFLRVYDAASGQQVAKFDAAPNVHTLPAPAGDWTIHNNEIIGRRSYASWYSNGIIALDLSPLHAAVPSDPVMVGQFVPPGARSRTPALIGNVAQVWGVFIREADGVIFASDMNSGLWIVRPVGAAAPSSA